MPTRFGTFSVYAWVSKSIKHEKEIPRRVLFASSVTDNKPVEDCWVPTDGWQFDVNNIDYTLVRSTACYKCDKNNNPDPPYGKVIRARLGIGGYININPNHPSQNGNLKPDIYHKSARKVCLRVMSRPMKKGVRATIEAHVTGIEVKYEKKSQKIEVLKDHDLPYMDQIITLPSNTSATEVVITPYYSKRDDILTDNNNIGDWYRIERQTGADSMILRPLF
jgi:hypothetical protein